MPTFLKLKLARISKVFVSFLSHQRAQSLLFSLALSHMSSLLLKFIYVIHSQFCTRISCTSPYFPDHTRCTRPFHTRRWSQTRLRFRLQRNSVNVRMFVVPTFLTCISSNLTSSLTVTSYVRFLYIIIFITTTKIDTKIKWLSEGCTKTRIL